MKGVAIIGAGSWGTALGLVAAAAAGHAERQVRLWSRRAEIARAINERRTNETYLPGVRLPPNIEATDDLSVAVAGAEMIVLAAPSHALRLLLGRLHEAAPDGALFVSATKGIEETTGMRVSEIFADVRPAGRFVCLSGPSFAREVAGGQPTALVAAARHPDDARFVQVNLSTPSLRIYTSPDVTGVEIGGAVKNVIAIAAGMVAGLGYGANSGAAIVTRGLAEMTRFALTQGARPETLAGLAGLGDLVLTCTGELSRNRSVGRELGRGRGLNEIIAHMKEVAEGVKTARAVHSLAERINIEMPITNVVHRVLYKGQSVREAADELMLRPLRAEF